MLRCGGVALTAVMKQNVSLGEVMTTEIIYKDAPCGKQFRVKRWETGYSVKCLHKRKTIVVRPYDEEFYQKDLNLFCTGCEKAKRQCLET